MLTISGLCVSYGSTAVLSGLELSVQSGEVHGLVGLNGSGKTTLLNTLYGFIKPQAGTILYNENVLSPKQQAYLEAESYFYSGITGREYLRLFSVYGKKADLTGWQQLLELNLDKLIDSYSTGMKKKLALVVTLLLDREIVVLDEPFNGLDIETSHILKLIVRRLREQGKTVLITSHIFESLATVCDYIHHLSGGHIEATYSKNDFVNLQGKLEGSIEEKAAKLLDAVL